MASVDPGRLGLHPATAKALENKEGTEAVVPALTDDQHRALAALSMAATEHRFRLDTQPGDVVFINNWAMLHARDSYEDGSGSGAADEPRRHLVRLWLRNSKLAWAVPDAMRAPREAAYGPAGDGNETNTKLYAVVPAPVYKVPKYTAGSAAFIIEDD